MKTGKERGLVCRTSSGFKYTLAEICHDESRTMLVLSTTAETSTRQRYYNFCHPIAFTKCMYTVRLFQWNDVWRRQIIED